MRDDLKLAAYAVALGYALEIQGCDGPRGFKPDLFDTTGIPHDGLKFVRGPVTVWDTARGWRVAKLEGDRYPKPAAEDFHTKLKRALDAGAAIPIPAKHQGPYSPELAEAFRIGARELCNSDLGDRINVDNDARVDEYGEGDGGAIVHCTIFVSDGERAAMAGEEEEA